MANHPSALKRARQSQKRRARNRAALSVLKTALKKVRTEFTSKKPDSIATALQKATAALARSASKGIIPKKRAARKTSRLALSANKLLTSATA